MSRAAFRQADMERVFRAARREGFAVQIDLRSLIVTAVAGEKSKIPLDDTGNSNAILAPGNLAPDGKENWDED